MHARGRHGFIATPLAELPEPARIAALCAGLIALGLVHRRR